MATHSEALVRRVRELVADTPGVVEKTMFGCLAFMLNGRLSVGVHEDELIVRVERDETEAALNEKGVRPFDLSGRPMSGWLLVGSPAIDTPRSLAKWVRRGLASADTAAKPRKRAVRRQRVR